MPQIKHHETGIFNSPVKRVSKPVVGMTPFEVHHISENKNVRFESEVSEKSASERSGSEPEHLESESIKESEEDSSHDLSHSNNESQIYNNQV